MATRRRTNTATNKRRKGLASVVLPWLRRFGVALAALTVIIWLGAWFFLSDADTNTANWIRDRTVEQTAALGFAVDDILVKGRVHTDPAVLKALINVQKGEPLFAFDPMQAKAQIEKIAWVETAHVQRRWPDTLYVELKERQPLALWQKHKKLRLLDMHGEVITGADISLFKDSLIIIGDDAPAQAPALMAYLAAEPYLAPMLVAATRVDGRRWDLTLKNGQGNEIKVKMPEEDFGLALRSFVLKDQENNILSKDILEIDMREIERMIVRTRPGAVREYKAGFLSDTSSSDNNI